MHNKLKIRESKLITTTCPDGDLWELVGLDDWTTKQIHRYTAHVFWKNKKTGECVGVVMTDEDAKPSGTTSGLKTAQKEMEKMGRPCKGRWDRSDYKEMFADRITDMRSKGKEGFFLEDDPTEEVDSAEVEGGE